VAIVVNQVFAARLDPLIPPTFTPTATPVTLTPTPTATATSTPFPTATNTPVPTATPALARLTNTAGRGLDLLQSPGGPSIGKLQVGQAVTVLYSEQVSQGLVWLEVQDSAGRIGWVPQIYLTVVTLTPSPTLPPVFLPTP